MHNCQQCGMRMYIEANDEIARQTGCDPANFVHVCGGCKTFHKVDAGSLRKLTPAELFELHLHQAEVMNRIERMKIEVTAEPCVTAMVPEGMYRGLKRRGK